MRPPNKARIKRFLGLYSIAFIIFCFTLSINALASPFAQASTVSAQESEVTLIDQEEPASGSEPAFYVAGFRFTGNTAFTQEELSLLLDEKAGRELTLPELEEAAARIARFYRDRGYLFAGAHVPPQEVVDGVVEIAIVEGRYGQVVLDNASALRDGTARALLGSVRPGALIEEGALDRAIRLLNETPGVRARASLRAGSEAGTSDLTVQLSKTRAVNTRITVDNAGSVYVQRTRTAVSVDLDNLVGLGDQLAVRWIGAGSGMSHWHVGYEAYLGAPWRWGVSYSSPWYKLGEAFDVLDATGKGDMVQLTARYPLVRSARHAHDVSFAYDVKTVRDEMLGEETAARIRAFSASASWTRRAGGAGGVSGGVWVSVIPGSLKFLSDWAARDDAATARAAGSFVRVEAGGSGRVPLSPRAALLVSASGQWASKNLYRSEKFTLGGPNGVRAYRVGEASGDLGFVVRTEARYALPVSGRWMRALEVGTFIDYGSVTINRRPWPGAGSPNHRTLVGAGVGLTYAPTDAAAVRLEYAVPLGNNTAGSSRAKPQFWLRLEMRL